jgi:hypothetical protein
MRQREFITLLGGAVCSDYSQLSSEPILTASWLLNNNVQFIPANRTCCA